jgi:Ricin-type beta-trefoil lectin domain-like
VRYFCALSALCGTALSACSFHSLNYLGDLGSGAGASEAGGALGEGSPASAGASGVPESGGTASGATGDAVAGDDAGGAGAAGKSATSGAGAPSAPDATCSDGIKNDLETDVDCGGRACAACADGARCVVNADCTSLDCLARVCTPPSACQSASCALLTNNAKYIFQPRHDTTKCADDRGRNLFNGASVIQYACNGQSGQGFIAMDRGNGYFAFKNVLNGRCLEVAGSKLTANAVTDLYTCSGADNQLWLVSATSAGFFKLVAKHSGMALDVQGVESTVSDLSLVQNPYDDSLDMQWRLDLMP